ncbi:cysteine--tRNA ligase, partial [Candidatus Saccharibacteria bacterium]|nr:cysteine--tRNA ligase [Candidatus Saccharibacteria bacterium]
MKKLRLKNSLGNTYQDFEPIDPSEVRYYHCGPTPYDYAHIGNLRSFLFADILI